MRGKEIGAFFGVRRKLSVVPDVAQTRRSCTEQLNLVRELDLRHDSRREVVPREKNDGMEVMFEFRFSSGGTLRRPTIRQRE